jgi:hypothetical protein
MTFDIWSNEKRYNLFRFGCSDPWRAPRLARPSSAGTWLFRTPSGCVGECQRRTEPEAVCKVDGGSGSEMATGRKRSGSFFGRCVIIARGRPQPDNRSGSLPDHILTNQITPRGGRKGSSHYQWPGFRSGAVMASDDEGAIAPPTHQRGATVPK